MRMLRINWELFGRLGESLLSNLSRISHYWPFSWRGLSAIILGVLLAKWFWIMFAPHAIYTAAVPARSAGAEAGQLFGVAVVTDTANQGVALPNVQLLGVYTASAGKPGFAMLKLDNNRQTGIVEGEEVAAGTRLTEVHADYVILERAGVQQRVKLENKYAGSPASAEIMNLPAYGAAAKLVQDKVVPGENTPYKLQQPRR